MCVWVRVGLQPTLVEARGRSGEVFVRLDVR